MQIPAARTTLWRQTEALLFQVPLRQPAYTHTYTLCPLQKVKATRKRTTRLRMVMRMDECFRRCFIISWSGSGNRAVQIESNEISIVSLPILRKAERLDAMNDAHVRWRTRLEISFNEKLNISRLLRARQALNDALRNLKSLTKFTVEWRVYVYVSKRFISNYERFIIHKADADLRRKWRISVWTRSDTRYSSSRSHKTDILMGTPR